MELTKFERRVMNPRYLQKCRWNFMFLGLICFAIGLIIVAYGYMKVIPQMTVIWENNASILKEIVPNTKNEKEMFEISMSTIESAKEGWIKYVEEKSTSASIFFFICGSFLVGIYYREKRYSKLIEKIKAPNNSVQ